jgi:hypothetical protein
MAAQALNAVCGTHYLTQNYSIRYNPGVHRLPYLHILLLAFLTSYEQISNTLSDHPIPHYQRLHYYNIVKI